VNRVGKAAKYSGRFWSYGPVLVIGAVFLTLSLAGCGGGKPPPNIVLICLDTVRDDYTKMGGSNAGLTPQLDRLAAAGTTFTNAWAPAPWTVPSHASFFTGFFPSEHGCNHQNLRLPPGKPTLAEILTGAGYRTAAFFSNIWLADQATNLLRGFNFTKQGPMSGGLPGDPGHYRGDQGGRAASRFAAEWLRALPGEAPFFLFVNFLEAHLPYDPDPAFRQGHLTDLPAADQVTIEWSMEYHAGLHPAAQVDWTRVQRLYSGDVGGADRLLGDLWQTLQDLELDQNTVVIVLSDHGENLGDHGLVEHQFSVHETLLAVPLVICFRYTPFA